MSSRQTGVIVVMSWKITIFFILEFLIQYNLAQSGSSCKTPNGESARCVTIYSCGILREAVRTQNQQQIRFLRESQCGYYNNSPYVCCGSHNNYNKQLTAKRPKSNVTAPINPRIFDRTKCGVQDSDHIINGEDTDITEFPWMALLQYRKPNGELRFSCGGTLISSKYVLTAAHCVTGLILTKIGPLINVRLGEWNTQTDIDCIKTLGIDICNDSPVDIRVEESIPHPDYNDNDINRYNDIGLIRLSKAVTSTQFIVPICLPAANDQAQIGDQLHVSGWGKTENSSSSAKKQKLQVPIVSQSRCSNKFRSLNVAVTEGQLCAGGERAKDSCTGDSGGPLMTITKNSRTPKWYIEGIVSFGYGCGTEGWPGVYTKVSEYVDWIYDTVRE